MSGNEYANRVICNGVTVRDVQLKSLEILAYFQEICTAHNLRYWCGGGTLIGALRHQGFIPWDDDIDVFMPRPDYERLYQIWNKVADTKRFALCRTDEHNNYHQTDMQLVDLNTTFINRHSVNEDIKHGVSIDIMPFEGCPNGSFRRLMQIYHSVFFCVFNVQRLPDNQGKVLRFLTKLLLGSVRSPARRYHIWKKHEKKMAQYDFDEAQFVKETITSFRALFFPHPRHYFDTKEVQFENLSIRIPLAAHEYLTRVFGDYLKYPPEESRRIKHDVVFVDLARPFSEFKGIHYLKDSDAELHRKKEALR